VVVERRSTERGELVLRRAGRHFEVIADGTFLMDSRDGRSERALVREALAGTAAQSVLLAGLGVGFSLDEALRRPGVRRVLLVEAEPDVVRWARTHLRDLNEHGLDDPRVELVVDDAVAVVPRLRERFDAVCLDVDNGPGWLARPGNAELYTDEGLARLGGLLAPRGRLAIWAAARDEAFERRLERAFGVVRVVGVPVARGEDDAAYVAARPGPSSTSRRSTW
jgi:spermidine synthase